MTNLFANRTSQIGAGQVISGIAKREQIVRVVCGQVWLTVEGSSQDYWLSGGESVTVPKGRLVVIEADRLDSRVDVPGAAPAHGVLHYLAGRVQVGTRQLTHLLQ